MTQQARAVDTSFSVRSPISFDGGLAYCSLPLVSGYGVAFFSILLFPVSEVTDFPGSSRVLS